MNDILQYSKSQQAKEEAEDHADDYTWQILDIAKRGGFKDVRAQDRRERQKKGKSECLLRVYTTEKAY